MKIGITGIANGGKTVFLTSLLWQLAELESADFTVSPKIGVYGFSPRNQDSDPDDVFPFETYRDKLVNGGQWPAKTKASHRYTCKINRKDWAKINFGRLRRMLRWRFSSEQRLEFFDFPGERIADAAIAAFEEYGAWSDHIIHHFKSHADYSAAVSPYLTLLHELVNIKSRKEKPKTPVIAEKIVHAYKLALAGLIYGYKPLVSPSTFLLDNEGTMANALPYEELAKTRLSGLSAKSQFAPLTPAVRDAFPKLSKHMARRYKEYRAQLAWPLFKEITQSQCLIILVDIPSLLTGGVGRYNDNRQILLDLFDSIEPKSELGALFQKLQAFFGLGLEKIAFVAVKSDLVRPDDIVDGRLESLLRQMTVRAKNTLPDVEFGYFVCGAIHSTRAGGSPHHLIGRPTLNNPDRAEMEFEVSSLPETWPEDWAVGDYKFAEVFPETSKCLMIPPKQIGLDRLFEFLLTERGNV